MRAIDAHPSLDLIHAFEGRGGNPELVRTTDPDGKWEIGWSHKLAGPTDPLWDAVMTPETSDALAMADLTGGATLICDEIAPEIIAGLSTGQWAVINDFAYNEGAPRFLGSTLCHFIKIGNLAAVPDELGKWIYAHNQAGKLVVLPGLVRRRQAEVQVWNESAVAAPLNV